MDIVEDISVAYLLIAMAIVLVCGVLWAVAGKKMLVFHDYLRRPNVSLVSTVLFFAGLGLVGFNPPIPANIAKIVGLALIMFYLLPVLTWLSSLFSGGVEKHRPQEEGELPPPSPPSPLL